jgi:hypothetical protein
MLSGYGVKKFAGKDAKNPATQNESLVKTITSTFSATLPRLLTLDQRRWFTIGAAKRFNPAPNR